jgi:hypothetical protein
MKTLVALAALVAVTTLPALAQDHGHGNNGYGPRHAPPPPPHRMMNRHRYHEGQSWNGHRLTNRNGHWGYYQPRNGAQVFISIPL